MATRELFQLDLWPKSTRSACLMLACVSTAAEQISETGQVCTNTRLRGFTGDREAKVKKFSTKRLPVYRDHVAPDGADVRVLLGLPGGDAHFELAPGCTSQAVSHRTVEEIWFFLSGRGEMWRRLNGHEETVPVDAGVALTIPAGTHFQFRSYGYDALAAIGITMPLWADLGERESDEWDYVQGRWEPTEVPRRS